MEWPQADFRHGAHGCCSVPVRRDGTVPDHLHDLIENPSLVSLRSLHVRLGIPCRDLGSRIHRQFVFHTQQCSPFRGHSDVRHGETFAGTFRESRREVDTQPLMAFSEFSSAPPRTRPQTPVDVTLMPQGTGSHIMIMLGSILNIAGATDRRGDGPPTRRRTRPLGLTFAQPRWIVSGMTHHTSRPT